MLRLKSAFQLRKLQHKATRRRERMDYGCAAKAALRNECDGLLSLLIRNRDCHFCQRCGKTQSCGAAHFIKRGNFATRYDAENVDWLCFGCHITYFHHDHGEEHARWKQARMGPARFAALMDRAGQHVHVTIPWLQEQKCRLETELKIYGIGA